MTEEGSEEDRLIDDLEWQIHDLKMQLHSAIRERDHYRRVLEELAQRAYQMSLAVSQLDSGTCAPYERCIR